MSKLWKPFDWIFNIYKDRRMKSQEYKEWVIQVNEKQDKLWADSKIALEQFMNHMLEGTPISQDSSVLIVSILSGRTYTGEQFRKNLKEKEQKDWSEWVKKVTREDKC
jgi:hypothetical protein